MTHEKHGPSETVPTKTLGAGAAKAHHPLVGSLAKEAENKGEATLHSGSTMADEQWGSRDAATLRIEPLAAQVTVNVSCSSTDDGPQNQTSVASDELFVAEMITSAVGFDRHTGRCDQWACLRGGFRSHVCYR